MDILWDALLVPEAGMVRLWAGIPGDWWLAGRGGRYMLQGAWWLVRERVGCFWNRLDMSEHPYNALGSHTAHPMVSYGSLVVALGLIPCPWLLGSELFCHTRASDDVDRMVFCLWLSSLQVTDFLRGGRAPLWITGLCSAVHFTKISPGAGSDIRVSSIPLTKAWSRRGCV